MNSLVERAFDSLRRAFEQLSEHDEDDEEYDFPAINQIENGTNMSERGNLAASTRQLLPKSICHAFDFWVGDSDGARVLLWKVTCEDTSGYLLWAEESGADPGTGYSEVFDQGGGFVGGCYWLQGPCDLYHDLQSWMGSVANSRKLTLAHEEMLLRFEDPATAKFPQSAPHRFKAPPAWMSPYSFDAPSSEPSAKPTEPQSWMDASVEEIKNSIKILGVINSNPLDARSALELSLGFPLSAVDLFNEPHYQNWIAGPHPPYQNWSCWMNFVCAALSQLRWELVTDPEQKPRSLGLNYLKTSHLGERWHESTVLRTGLFLESIRMYRPALSNKTYFRGHLLALLEFQSDRKVTTRVLESTLLAEVSARIKGALDSLNGHPVVTFPEGAANDYTMRMVVDLNFQAPEKLL